MAAPYFAGRIRMVNAFGGNWTRDKLRILEDYLKAYTTALKNQSFRLWYVDAFAGTGYVNMDSGEVIQGNLLFSEGGWDIETANILKGSVRRAIDVDDKPFDEFVFVDLDFGYAAELSKLRHEFRDRNIHVVSDDANTFLQNWCVSRNRHLGTPWDGERAVVFLDPFATEVDWQTVQSISETLSVDLWVLFPLSALTRMLPNEREPDNASAAHLDRVFGGSEWREALYRVSSQATLFGDETQTVRAHQQAIVDLYLAKLRKAFPAVSNSPRWFRNSRNSPLFALMFAAANERGGPIALRIANNLLNRW
jgi:three-Cys-motif partner protein